MKTIIGIIFAMMMLVVACATPPADVPRAEIPQPADGTSAPTGNVVAGSTEMNIDFTQSTFEFTGYGPGKEHVGTFDTMNGVLILDETGLVIGAKGTIVADSVNTTPAGVVRHLKTADFFNTEVYNEIVMESTSIVDGQLTGTLTFHGVTQELSFPVTAGKNRLQADTIISLKAFGIEFPGVNDEVRIQFDLVSQ